MLCWLRIHRWVVDVYRWPLRDLCSGDVGFYCARCDAVRWNLGPQPSERVCPHHESFGSCPVFGCPHHQPSERESDS